ncbi:MAG: HAMP domain-containing histidine kinase [Actinomycetota bacterium]|nr:HAMP domain-containing histidine kinase [Actinomycetota bacterium]
MKRLPLRASIALLCAATTAAAIVAASVLGWVSTRSAMRDQIDASLGQGIVRAVRIDGFETTVPIPAETLCEAPRPPGDSDVPVPMMQLLRADGSGCAGIPEDELIDPTTAELQVARGERASLLRDATTLGGEHVRTQTTALGDGYAVRVSRSLEEVDATMRELTMILGLVAALGVLVAGGAGLAVARIVVRPVDRLTAAAEHVADTEDLDVPIEVRGRDEVARLSTAFNSMIERLAGSRRRQRQLIADSSHELRTPLTSLRTNIEWLMRADDRGRPLGAKQRRQVEQAVLGQVDELSALIGELGALARDERVRDHVAVELDQVVLRAVDRAQRRDPSRRFDLRIEPWPVRGDPAALERAVLNLLDNALKFSDGPIAVSLRGGHVAVYDTGAGLSGADQGNAFERFWRAPAARELPGSGLGLAIVADSVGQHGGTVFFTDAPGGGSRVGFTIPALTKLSVQPRETHT